MCPPETARAGAAFPNPALLLSDLYQIPSANRDTMATIQLQNIAGRTWILHRDRGRTADVTMLKYIK